jgi:hypothetical protein
LSSFADGVGQDEHPLPLVWSANFRRAKYAPRRSVTKLSQVVQDVTQPEGNVSFDVFKEADSRLHPNNSICDVGPEVSGVFGAESLSGC